MRAFANSSRVTGILAGAVVAVLLVAPIVSYAQTPPTAAQLAAANTNAQAIIDAYKTSTTIGPNENMSRYPAGTVAGANNNARNSVYTLGNVTVTCGTDTVGSFCESRYNDGSPNGLLLNPNYNTDSGGTTVNTNAQGQTTTTSGVAEAANAAVKAVLSPFKDALLWIVKQVALIFLFISGAFVSLAGAALNTMMYISIFQFGNIIGNNAGMIAAWGVLRDIGNILLLFGFIFLGVSTILNLPRSEFTAKSALPRLIIFAVLMNFSLFAAEAVIDVSNAFGTAIYKAGVATQCTTGDLDCVRNNGLSGAILKLTGVQALWSSQYIQQILTGGSMSQIIAILGLTVFILITAFVFFAAVIMFLVRMIVLAFLMVTSPIGFAGMALPPLHDLATRWWDALIKQSMFAPIFLLMIIISIKFMQGVAGTLNGGNANNISLAAVFSNNGISNIGVIIIFALMCGFMLAAVMIANQMGAVMASNATRASGALVFGGMARVSNLAVGGTSRLARQGVQRATGNSSNRFVRTLGVASSNVFRAGENANLDVRRAGVGKLLTAAGAGAAAGPAEHASFNDMRHQVDSVKKEMAANERKFQDEARTSQLTRELHGNQPLSPESKQFMQNLSAEQILADHELEHSINDMARSEHLSTKTFNELMKSKLSQQQKDDLRKNRLEALATRVESMTADAFEETVAKSEHFTDEQKKKLRDSRFEDTAALIATAQANPNDAAAQKAAKDAIQKISEKDMGQFAQSSHADFMGSDVFARSVTDDQADKIKSNQSIKAASKTVFSDARDRRFSNTPTTAGGPTHAEVNIPGLTPENFGKLSASTLADPHVLAQANGKQLAKIDPNKLNQAQSQEVIRHLEALDGAASPEFDVFENLVTANPTHPWKGTTINGRVL